MTYPEWRKMQISIHSLRAERDREARLSLPGASISIHSLRAERDLIARKIG